MTEDLKKQEQWIEDSEDLHQGSSLPGFMIGRVSIVIQITPRN